MKSIEYYKPRDLAAALSLKAEKGEEAVFIAGGTDVMVDRRHKRINPQALISLRGIEDLRGIRVDGNDLFLGAGVTLTQILKSPEVTEHLPILQDAASVMGSTQMRNVATVGGNVMTAVSSGDTLGPLLCLDALCILVSSEGKREVPMDEMFLGPRTTAAQPGEILQGMRISLPAAGGRRSSGAFIKITRRAALDLALLNVSAQLWVDEDGVVIQKARLAAGVAGPTPLRLKEAENILEGAPVGEALKEHGAARAVGRDCKLRDSDRCSSWYREDMVRALLPRVAGMALERMGADLPSNEESVGYES